MKRLRLGLFLVVMAIVFAAVKLDAATFLPVCSCSYCEANPTASCRGSITSGLPQLCAVWAFRHC